MKKYEFVNLRFEPKGSLIILEEKNDISNRCKQFRRQIFN